MLSYPMALRSQHPLDEVEQAARGVLGVPSHDGEPVAGALRVAVRDVDHPVTAEVYRDLLGEPASCRVLWYVENKGDEEAYGTARRLMAVSAAELARRLDAEATLTFQLDRVVMRRQRGSLSLYRWFPEWQDPDVQSALREPFVLTDDDGRS